MPKFGKTSRKRLDTCHEDLQTIANELIKIMDVTVLCGHRTKEEQNDAYDSGNSKLRYPKSKHNKSPSLAMDLAPWPIEWDNKERFHEMAGIVKGIAHSKGIKVKWGGDFTSFFDGPHFELEE